MIHKGLKRIKLEDVIPMLAANEVNISGFLILQVLNELEAKACFDKVMITSTRKHPTIKPVSQMDKHCNKHHKEFEAARQKWTSMAFKNRTKSQRCFDQATKVSKSPKRTVLFGKIRSLAMLSCEYASLLLFARATHTAHQRTSNKREEQQ